MTIQHPREWMAIRPEGLYCEAGDFYVDPVRPVARAVITHGHADHARSGHGTVYATPATLEIMWVRYGAECCENRVPLEYGEKHQIGDVTLWFAPAGHILGSAQAVLEYGQARIVISGDYKRTPDPTCEPFRPVPCDVFVTEATFGLPVFTHPPIEHELKKLLDSLALFPDRCHLVGCYALGKCQRLIMGLRQLGYDKPIYLHGALMKLCTLYAQLGVELGELIPVSEVDKKALSGQIVLAPPSALADRWSRNLPNVMTSVASGWMNIRARAKQKLVELPLIISDHCDWKELLQTVEDVGAPEIWVTHGREEALVYELRRLGYSAQALTLLGYEEEED
ncbi:MAG: ligase-associated DNA damage response exonuclease [Alphaproteobacteria bacterium]|nr:ligase-associated DNA damage response exonuclease [Alphaproteobacteria bacterium]